MRLRKIIIAILSCSMILTSGISAMAASPRTGASAVINLESKEYDIPGDFLYPGQVIQMNIGNSSGSCGYRFYGVNAYLGTDQCIVMESLNMTSAETITAPVSAQVEKLKGLTGHVIHSKEFSDLMVTQWIFAGFSEEGYAQFYGVWDNYKAASDATRERQREADKNEGHTHSYGGDPVITVESTMTNPGVETMYCVRPYCDAGDSRPITYGGYMKDIAKLIKYSPDNATVRAENPTYTSPADYVMEALNKRPDVTLILNQDKIYRGTAREE